LLSPSSYEDRSLVHERHLADQRSTSSDEQRHVVNTVIDIVMRNMGIERPSGLAKPGRSCERKCNNLLNAEPQKPLILDWDGVPLVSSSFADECVGKLFVELGPLAFSRRVRNVGMEPVVRAVIDRAVL
jgi:hypothetical protein